MSNLISQNIVWAYGSCHKSKQSNSIPSRPVISTVKKQLSKNSFVLAAKVFLKIVSCQFLINVVAQNLDLPWCWVGLPPSLPLQAARPLPLSPSLSSIFRYWVTRTGVDLQSCQMFSSCDNAAHNYVTIPNCIACVE